jgi:hypothetical protein
MIGGITATIFLGTKMLTMERNLIDMETIGGSGDHQLYSTVAIGGGPHFGVTGHTIVLMTTTTTFTFLGAITGATSVSYIVMFLVVGLGIMNGVTLTSNDMLSIMDSTTIIGRLHKFNTTMQLLTHNRTISSAIDGLQHSLRCLGTQHRLKERIYLRLLKIMNCS